MIKSDRWIIRMAGERKMIEPFEARQVKMVDGKPVISYGFRRTDTILGWDARLKY